MDEKKIKNIQEIETPAVEDLMKEHGLLNRVLLIYEEILNRINKNQEFRIEIVSQSANIIRDFIENYHEKNEEEYIFPRLVKFNQLTEMVATLLEQHQVGRKITAQILELTSSKSTLSSGDMKKLAELMSQFVCMYRAHESREDTEAFPLFKKYISMEEYNQLSEIFEDTEHELFGEHGFNNILNKVANIEKELGIHDLDTYTADTGKKCC